MKILVYNKMKQKGLSYEQAKKEVELEVNHLKDLTQKKREEKNTMVRTKHNKVCLECGKKISYASTRCKSCANKFRA